MLQYFTQLFFPRTLIMAFYSRNFSLVPGVQNYARPFEDIVYSYDPTSTANNVDLSFGEPPTKDKLT